MAFCWFTRGLTVPQPTAGPSVTLALPMGAVGVAFKGHKKKPAMSPTAAARPAAPLEMGRCQKLYMKTCRICVYYIDMYIYIYVYVYIYIYAYVYVYVYAYVCVYVYI